MNWFNHCSDHKDPWGAIWGLNFANGESIAASHSPT